MTDLINSLETLAGKVTPGDWKAIGTDPAEGGDWFWIKAQPSPVLRGFTTEIGVVNGSQSNPEQQANAAAICLLRNNLPTLIAALKVAELVRDEDWLASQIPASSRSDAYHYARAIIAGLEKETPHDHD